MPCQLIGRSEPCHVQLDHPCRPQWVDEAEGLRKGTTFSHELKEFLEKNKYEHRTNIAFINGVPLCSRAPNNAFADLLLKPSHRGLSPGPCKFGQALRVYRVPMIHEMFKVSHATILCHIKLVEAVILSDQTHRSCHASGDLR